MEHISPSQVLTGLGVVAIILELLLGVATGFDLFIIGLIFIVSGLIGTSVQNDMLAYSLVGILSFLYILVGRQFVRAKLSVRTHKTSTDALIGKQGVVVKVIHKNNPGQVKVDGEIWRAESHKSIGVGKEVTVQSISGITLQVT